MDSTLKRIRIQTGVVKRLKKDMEMYTQEERTEVAKIEQMSRDNIDEYAIRQQKNVIDETRLMIPDTKRRLDNEIEALAALLLTPGYEDTDEVKDAKQILLSLSI
eukprot:CFRG1165T1